MTDEEILKQFKRWAILRSCLHCMHWNEQKEICDKFKQKPPIKTIIEGCQHHDVIPF